MKKLVSCLVCVLLGVFAGSSSTTAAQDSGRQIIRPAGSSGNFPFSPGILVDGTLYVAGQGSANAQDIRPADFRGQVKQSMENVRSVLQAAGMDFGNVVWMNVYLSRADNIDAMNDVYWKEIGANPPARSVMVIGSLVGGDTVEINCIAVKDKAHRRAIWPSGWPKGPHVDPPAIQANDVLYLSAQNGADPKTGKLADSFTGETRQALDNVAAILHAAHMSMKNVLWVNPYMSVSGQYDAMGNVYKTYFEFGNTPGRGTIQVVALPNGSHIVFSCIAGADLAKRKAIRPRNMPPSATASPGILYGNTLYLSAKDGFIPGQGIVTPDFNLQLRQSMRNLLDGLEEADMDFSNVVFTTVYLRDIQDFDKMNNLYKTFFKGGYPARTTMQQNFDSSAEDAEQLSFIAVKAARQ
ncbi:MAG TPA: RidA family protein [Candidatus Sulfotelmatobacter sp.]|nr:RidA family protein [Candidatus Sulfotelmatobacter sp.]